VDAIQSLTGCTFGKGNLIHRDYGKNSYTFIRHRDGKAVRISTRPDGWPPDPPERQALFEKVRAGTDERALAVLTIPEDRLFDVREVLAALPQSNRGIASAPCDGCGELTRATHLHRIGDRALCGACLEGAGSGEARR